jgi:hypothetical protein
VAKHLGIAPLYNQSRMSRLRAFFNPPTPNPLRAPIHIFWTGLIIRVLYMTLAHTYRIRPAEDHFQFGFEAGRIARALVTGYGYSDPFASIWLAHTGPTAWLPPLYPLLLAGIFRCFGVYTPTSAWVLFAFQSVLSAATALAVWEIAARCFDRKVALWSAWLWALYPAAMQYAVRWTWETSITTALFAWVIVLALRMRQIGEPIEFANGSSANSRRWALFGLLWGLIALANSALLLFMPVCGLWTIRGDSPQRMDRSSPLRGATLAAFVFCLCVVPWTWRNYKTFHTFIPLRGNLGAELYMGDGPGSTGLAMTYEHPHTAPDQLKLYASLGEVRYTAMRGRLAREYIRSHPAHFIGIVAKRIYFFWGGVPSDDRWAVETIRVLNFSFISLAGLMGLGLALQRRAPAAGLFAWAFVLLPLTYYFVFVHARFRHPLEPLICVLGVYLFQSATRTKARSIAG